MTDSGLVIRLDGRRPLSADSIAELAAVCDAVEDGATHALVVIRVSGVPGPEWARDLSAAMVSKWERGLRRLERLPAVTIAVADADCGGIALDALLATDYRIMLASAKLVVPAVAGETWPGMALYRLVRQTAGAADGRRAVLFGAPIEAAAAQALGVIDEVVGDAATALAKARELTAVASGTEHAIRRQLMLEAPTTSFEDALGVHLAACDRVLRRTVAEAT